MELDYRGMISNNSLSVIVSEVASRTLSFLGLDLIYFLFLIANLLFGIFTTTKFSQSPALSLSAINLPLSKFSKETYLLLEDCILQLSNSSILIDRKSTRLNSSHRCISYAV